MIATPFITPERQVRVPVPTINSLLGDKLTAFAPRTIGILYNPLRKPTSPNNYSMLPPCSMSPPICGSLRFRPDQVATLRDLQIQPPWSPLTRLKGATPQAFHHWYQAQRILTS